MREAREEDKGMTKKLQPWVLSIVIEIIPGYEEEFLQLVSDVIDQMRHEPNFVSTVLCRDTKNSSRFFLFEIWIDREDFYSIQLHRDYRNAYSAAIDRISRTPRQIVEWRQLRADYALRL